MEIETEIAIFKDDVNSQMHIQVKNLYVNEIEKVNISKFYRCMSELGINDIYQLHANFRRVCNWFLLEEMNVEFEEFLVGSAS